MKIAQLSTVLQSFFFFLEPKDSKKVEFNMAVTEGDERKKKFCTEQPLNLPAAGGGLWHLPSLLCFLVRLFVSRKWKILIESMK